MAIPYCLEITFSHKGELGDEEVSCCLPLRLNENLLMVDEIALKMKHPNYELKGLRPVEACYGCRFDRPAQRDHEEPPYGCLCSRDSLSPSPPPSLDPLFPDLPLQENLRKRTKRDASPLLTPLTE